MDSATEFLFGQCVHSLSASRESLQKADAETIQSIPSESPSRAFAAAFSEAQDVVARRVRLGHIWPLWEIKEDKTTRVMDTVEKYLEPILKAAVEKAKMQGLDRDANTKWDEDADVDGETLLDHLIKHTQGQRLSS